MSYAAMGKLLVKPAMALAGVAATGYAWQQWDDAAKVLKLDYMPDAEIDKLFEKIDVDHSGCISEEELRTALGLKLSHFTLHAMIDAADADHNGEIDKNEFKALVHRIQRSHHTEAMGRQRQVGHFPAAKPLGLAGGDSQDKKNELLYEKFAKGGSQLKIKREPSATEIDQIKRKLSKELHEEEVKGGK
jgi:EF-hand domain pair